MKKWVILFLALCVAFPVAAEFSCSSDIRYSWKRGGLSPTPVVTTTPVPNPTATPVAAESSQEGKLDVFWASVEAKGDTEEDAKNSLVELINRERSKADGGCKELHENQSKCLASKFGLHASIMKIMSFEQRKAFEKKMVQDCEQQAGFCLGSAATEPKCREIVVAKADQSTDTKGKEKDAKKK